MSIVNALRAIVAEIDGQKIVSDKAITNAKAALDTYDNELHRYCLTWSAMTPEQKDAYNREVPRWSRVSEPIPYGDRDGCVMIECFYKNGGSIWIGIEKDGYAHS